MDKPYIINGIEIKPGMGLIACDKDTKFDNVFELSHLYVVFPISGDMGVLHYGEKYMWDLLKTLIKEKTIYKIYDIGSKKSILGKLLWKNDKI